MAETFSTRKQNDTASRISKQTKMAKIHRHISASTLGQTWILISWAVAAVALVRAGWDSRPLLRPLICRIYQEPSTTRIQTSTEEKKSTTGKSARISIYISVHANFGPTKPIRLPKLLFMGSCVGVCCVGVCTSRMTLIIDTIIRRHTLVGFCCCVWWLIALFAGTMPPNACRLIECNKLQVNNYSLLSWRRRKSVVRVRDHAHTRGDSTHDLSTRTIMNHSHGERHSSTETEICECCDSLVIGEWRAER